jgi:hypothetical protein
MLSLGATKQLRPADRTPDARLALVSGKSKERQMPPSIPSHPIAALKFVVFRLLNGLLADVEASQLIRD